MIPLTFLTAVIGVTIAAFVGQIFARSATAVKLRHLATKHGMQFAAADLFQITPHIAEKFPIPGVSDVRVMDVIYSRSEKSYRYVFTVEYTFGVVRTKRRIRRAGTVLESGEQGDPRHWSTLELSPETLPIEQQYAAMLAKLESPS